jgi:hypothetical protein
MFSKVRMIVVLAFVFAFGAVAAGAQPSPPHRPHAHAAGFFDTLRVGIAAWLGEDAGRLSAIRGGEGSQMDPNGSPKQITGTILPPPPVLPCQGSSC